MSLEGASRPLSRACPIFRTGTRAYDYSWKKGRVLAEYQALYVTRGAAEFESKPTGSENVAVGNVILLFPGVWHRYRPVLKAGWGTYWIATTARLSSDGSKTDSSRRTTPFSKSGITTCSCTPT